MRTALAAAAFAAILAISGCSSAPEAPEEDLQGVPSIVPADAQSDPLIDAPYRTLVECEAASPLTAGKKFGSVVLSCPALRVSATITELRDAGWRIETLRMMEGTTEEGAFAIPFSVSIRKLY